jgi:hypothetical protein
MSPPTAVDYVAAGLRLIPIPPIKGKPQKGAHRDGWNLEQNCIYTIEQAERLNGCNIGLAHRWSGTCAWDIDDYLATLPWLAKRGIALDSYLAADDAVLISSGRFNRCKLLYRLPDGVIWLPTLNLKETHGVGLELRCASKDGAVTVMDVLPPSIHEETLKPYVWAGLGDWRNFPELPEAFLALWRELAKPRSRKKSRRAEGVKVTEGGRNAYLMSRAGLMRHGGFGRETILAAMLVDNKTTCSPPLEEEEVEKIVASASRYEPGKAPPVGEDPDHTEDPDTWPAPLAKVAFHGLAGEIVDAILPDSESDPAALLVQTLLAFGATVGRVAYFQVEGTRHHGNLFALIIGKTAIGRKGTSMGRVLEIYNLVQDCPLIARGATTGEGLKWLIRDPIPAKPRKRKFKRHYLDPYNDENDDQGDPGVADKRVIVYESEFGQVLRVIPRQGNTLTVALKEFWDGNDVGSLTRHDPLKVTAPHVSFIGNITEEELRSCLSQVEVMSGFANRFLMVCSERSKILPEGGQPLDEKVAHSFAQRIAHCAGVASGFGRVTRTEEGSGYWASIYESLGAGEGAVARAAPQVLRLSLLYALLDQSARIDAVHIEAGLALWKYCESSVHHVFGSGDVGGQGNPALGDMLCERVLKWIQKVPEGQTERQLVRRFGGRVSIEQIRRASASLTESRLVMAQTRVGGNGREVTWWLPT